MAIIPSLSLNSLVGMSESMGASVMGDSEAMLNKTLSMAKSNLAEQLNEKDKLTREDLRKANEGTDAAAGGVEKATLTEGLQTSLQTSAPLKKLFSALGIDKAGGISFDFGGKV